MRRRKTKRTRRKSGKKRTTRNNRVAMWGERNWIAGPWRRMTRRKKKMMMLGRPVVQQRRMRKGLDGQWGVEGTHHESSGSESSHLSLVGG